MSVQIGKTASLSKTISESDVYCFAGLVGDFNGAHLNQIEAEKGIFGDRVAHGMLVGGLISAVLGMKLPGSGTVYLEQNLKFKKPVYFGDTVTAIVTVTDIVNKKKGIYRLDTIIKNQNGEIVTDGYAVVMYKGEDKDDKQRSKNK